jgi:hypothetical protein
VNTTAIYGLFDPRRPRVICYVGKGPARRAESHWRNFVKYGEAVVERKLENKRTLAGFVALRTAGVQPRWRYLETNVPLRHWKSREKFWVAYWRKRNPNLWNVSDGGNAYPLEVCVFGGRAVAERRLGIHAPGVASKYARMSTGAAVIAKQFRARRVSAAPNKKVARAQLIKDPEKRRQAVLALGYCGAGHGSCCEDNGQIARRAVKSDGTLSQNCKSCSAYMRNKVRHYSASANGAAR